MNSEDSSLHIVVLPWLAFGHLIPYLELSKSLARRGHVISFVSTPRNIQRLPAIPSELSPLITLVTLPMPQVEGLPENAESTADIPPVKTPLLMEAADRLEAPFNEFFGAACSDNKKSKKPDCILNDFLYYWVSPIAQQHKVPCGIFHVLPACFQAIMGPPSEILHSSRVTVEHWSTPPKWVPFPSNIAFPRHQAQLMAPRTGSSEKGKPSGTSDMLRRIVSTFEKSRFIAFRSSYELEHEWLPLVDYLHKKPAIPVGLLPPPLQENMDVNAGTTMQTNVMEWLARQPDKSVIYVALGSEAPVTAEGLRELAMGLELSNTRFLWALKMRAAATASDDGAGVTQLLPEGFGERTRERGLVAAGWVPQIRVLAHASVAAFLTHCGWGSAIEGVWFGHPLVMLPFLADQCLTARVMAEEKKVGVEVPRDERDGSFDRDGVAKTVRLVMVEEDGKVLASNAKKLQANLGDRDYNETYIGKFVEKLRSLKLDA